jgi:hypothetical protein
MVETDSMVIFSFSYVDFVESVNPTQFNAVSPKIKKIQVI